MTSIPARIPALIREYIDGTDTIADFHRFEPSMKGVKAAAAARVDFPVDRKVLVEVLQEQANASSYSSKEVLGNIGRLASDDVFTITTGHQLCLYGGPLFFVYKICSAIKWSKRLEAEGISAVPVYWMASEDHDFEEINHFFVEGQRFSWEHEIGGAVGEILMQGIEALQQELATLLGEDYHAQAHLKELQTMFAPGRTLSQAVRDLAYYLFATYGVVVIDAVDHRLKSLFKPLMKRELEESFSFNAVSESTEKLEQIGYHGQVTPREINLFFMEAGVRERIVNQDDHFALADGSREFSKAELFQLLEAEPEKFSPNVILRPLYQEAILPNLGYIGGPGELSYWLQLEGVFDSANVFFPAVLLRDMVAIANAKTQQRLDQLKLPFSAMVKKREELIKELLREIGTHEHLVTEKQERISKLMEGVIADLADFDPNMERSAKAEQTRINNRLEALRKKVLRSDKRLNETMVTRLDEALTAFFPGDVPQERVHNWLNYAGHIRDIIDWVAASPENDAEPKVMVYEIPTVD